jgi:NADH-quinone oxidoreductase subunit A
MLLDYLGVLIFLVAGAAFVGVSLFVSSLVRPSKYSPEKLLSYECGENPIGSPWVQFNIRFYVFALIYIVFAVEAVFLLPWAVVFKQLGLFAFIEGLLFVAILVVGLAYLWAKGDLEWVRTEDRAAHHARIGVPPRSRSEVVSSPRA